MPTESATKTPIDRSKVYACRFGCGYETDWPAARGRHEAARHNGHAGASAGARALSAKAARERNGKPPKKPLTTSARMDRLFEELRQHQEEMIQALRKASLLVLAERDLRAKEVEQIKSDLSAIYEVLERNRQDRQNRIGELIR
jgi:hypothetical protein